MRLDGQRRLPIERRTFGGDLDDLEGSVTKLSSSLRCPQENIVMMRGIRCSFKRNVLGVLRACLYLYCGRSAWLLSASTMRLALSLKRLAISGKSSNCVRSSTALRRPSMTGKPLTYTEPRAA